MIDDKPINVSCRKCSECLQVRANEWGVRCHHELMEHSQNCWLTLTYDNNPVRLHKEHLQLFIKRLRKSIHPKKIKYFSVGEYGDQNLRPHFHIMIFGHDFDDKVFWKKSHAGYPIFTSQQLNELCKYGIATVMEATKQTAMYSAKYQAKEKKDLPEFLQKYPEFNTMSKNLGIKGIMRKIDTYLKTKEIYIDGFAYAIPRLALEKYCDDNGFAEEEKKKFIHDYWERKSIEQIRSSKELETLRRLDNKRKIQQSLREL